jgi:hypothetical protein
VRKLTKRTALVAAGVAIAVAGTGIAYAYWSTSGSGSGTAATGGSSAITVNQTTTVSSMGPAVAAQALAGNFDNSNSGPVFVQNVTVAIATISNSLCTGADFTLVQPNAVNAEIPKGTAQGSWSGGSIAFKDDPARNQDACKNVTVNLSYTSN